MNRVVITAGAVLTSLVALTGLALADVAPDPDPEDGCGCASSQTGDIVPGALAAGVSAVGLAWVLRGRRQGPR